MLIIGNGRLITRSETNPYLENGAVVLDGDAVKETGTLEAMRAKYPEAERYMAEGHFAPGSMLPKVEAAVKFAESKTGRQALITLLEKARDGIAGKTGTIVQMQEAGVPEREAVGALS